MNDLNELSISTALMADLVTTLDAACDILITLDTLGHADLTDKLYRGLSAARKMADANLDYEVRSARGTLDIA